MGWLRGIWGSLDLSPPSPAVMREGAIGLRHFVSVLTLLDGVAPVVRRIEQFARQPFSHCFFTALARGRDDPANAQRLTARGAHFDRHLVRGTADAAGAHLDRGHHVVERLL